MMNKLIFLMVASSCVSLSYGKSNAWLVKVTTGSISTDDHVKIQLQGDQGSSDFMEVDDDRDNFETDKPDYFVVSTPDQYIGRVQSVTITLGNGEYSVEEVVISNVDSGDVVFCEFESGDINSASGMSATAECVPAKNPAYLLAISTGSDKSDAYQHVKLIGDKASTDFIRLEDATVDNWEAYSTNYLTIYPTDYSDYLGVIQSLVVKTESSSYWDLTDIVVTELDAETLKPKCTLEQIVCYYDGVSAGAQTPADVCVREAIAA